MKRPPRIATFLMEGRDMKYATDNKARLKVLRQVAKELAAHPEWHPLDAVVFPGGFLTKIPDAAARQFVKSLEKLSPGLQLVVGVDNKDGEQLAVAFNRQGRSGLARKLFPVQEDVDGTIPPVMLHEKDYADTKRLIDLPNGDRAILCVCYDMFGLGDAARGKSDKLDKALMVEDAEGEQYLGRGKGKEVLRRAFAAHRKMIKDEKPAVALATIHRFAEPGREIFWQRHGIASASAALGKGFAVAAAHTGILPGKAETMPLAANHVAKGHLSAGMQRQAHAKEPEDGILINAAGNKGWLRLFTA